MQLTAEHLSHRTKVLFVLSNDFGELSSALYFMKGQSLDATLAMPPRLATLQAKHVSVANFSYKTLLDVLELVHRTNPDIVLLFSAYLLGVNAIFSIDEISNLLTTLRRLGCRLATTDPFLGLLVDPGRNIFSNSHPRTQAVAAHLAELCILLRGTPHLYLGRVQNPPSHPSYSFFNPQIILPPDALGNAAEPQEHLATPNPRPSWLYVLSAEDYGLQAAMHGKQWIDRLLLNKIEETRLADRRPIVIAPQACVESIGGAARRANGKAMAFCNNQYFSSLHLNAEVVFYWNVFSESILTRAASRLPVAFFDRGHMARAMPVLYERGMEAYYGNRSLPFLKPQHPLSAATAGDLARTQAKPFEEGIAKLRALPTPAQVLAELLVR